MTDKKGDAEQIACILRDNITFSGQVGDYVIHGAIEKLIEMKMQEAIAFAVWIASRDGGEKIVLCDGQWYWETDEDGDQPLTEEQLYNLFKKPKANDRP